MPVAPHVHGGGFVPPATGLDVSADLFAQKGRGLGERGTAGADVVGEVGLLIQDIPPFGKGKVRFQRPLIGSDVWDCIADDPIEANARVRVVSVNGTLVLAEGDVNLTFKRYLERALTLRIVDDHIETIEGDGLDAELMRSYMAAWGDRAAYAVSHVGYGLNPAARWDSLAMLDKRDFNGTELRAFAGNFLYSTGANEVAGRYTLGHFDLPMRSCTVQLDGEVVVRDGQVA